MLRCHLLGELRKRGGTAFTKEEVRSSCGLSWKGELGEDSLHKSNFWLYAALTIKYRSYSNANSVAVD